MSDRKSVHITEKRKMNPRSLANLRPPWKKGEVPNPAGRPNAGAAVKEFLNAMQGLTKSDVEKIIADKGAPVNRIAAARLWLSACDSSYDLDRIMDRTDGRSTANVAIKGEVEHTVIVKSAMEKLIDDPVAWEAVRTLDERLERNAN